MPKSTILTKTPRGSSLTRAMAESLIALALPGLSAAARAARLDEAAGHGGSKVPLGVVAGQTLAVQNLAGLYYLGGEESAPADLEALHAQWKLDEEKFDRQEKELRGLVGRVKRDGQLTPAVTRMITLLEEVFADDDLKI